MLSAPRRITFFALLLLLPTLAVGAGAIVLLRREQARLDAQAQAAAEARRAAVEARARLIAENVELLVGDVQDALMSTLREAPAADADTFLSEWERTNSFVKGTFRLGPAGDVRRPPAALPGDMPRWLARWVQSAAPWRSGNGSPGFVAPEVENRRDVTANVSQTQSTRSAVKDMAAVSNSLQKFAAAPPAERTGWHAWADNGTLHLIGWRRPASGETIGVEANLSALAVRFAELLPKDGEFANAFVVRGGDRATVQRRDYRARPSWAVSKTSGPEEVIVPISTALLPGWEVAGFVAADSAGAWHGLGFFLVGALLVGIFVVAILSGGFLLLWQARRSEAEAAQKTSFVANVSHEFKTPLTTIRLYAELLEQGRVQERAKADEYLRTIGRETQRLARLVNNALDFSRLEQGRKKYARESLDLGAEIARLLDTHAPRIGEAGLVLRRDLPPAPLTATTDRDALEQIVLNLIDNACKYAADGGELTVAVRAGERGGACVIVADRGPGVPPEHRERIFEKFHRVDDALTAEKTGAGLGLSIARQLARGLGGELRCQPRAGAGAEFILELP